MHTLPLRYRLAVLCLSAAMLTACKPSNPTPPAPQNTVYDLRGVIERLGTNQSPRELIIHHEASKDMDSMSMPFSIAEGVSLNGLAVGDKVSFRVEADAKTDSERVTKLEKLPADTVLKFPGASTTAPAPASGMKAMPGM